MSSTSTKEPGNRLTVAETLLYSCMKLMPTKGGSPTGGTGTGFFYTFSFDEKTHVPTIVTNKHVVAGSDGLISDFHIGENNLPTDNTERYNLKYSAYPVVAHPDPDIDLVAIPIARLLEAAENKGKGIYYRGLAESNIPVDWAQFDALEEVTMVGCPRGIIDETNKLPIFRRGYSASHLGKLYNGRPEFLVDMACFPGSSGSPVFVYNQTSYYDVRKNTVMMGSGRFFFVGILYAGPLIQNNGELVLNQIPRVEVNSMMHLGQVTRSSNLLGIKHLIQKLL